MKLSRKFGRLLRRLKGQKRIEGFDIGIMKADYLYVHDPILPKIKKYVHKNYKWLIGTLIALVALSVTLYQVQIGSNKSTLKYYYVVRSKTIPVSVKTASCWPSIVSNRKDAYSCAVENRIYDPCYQKTNFDRSIVGCPASPDGQEDVFISTSSQNQQTIPDIFSYSGDVQPWYLTLSDNMHCRYLRGATDVIADKRMDYGCEDKGRYLQLPIEEKDGVMNIRCYNPKLEVIEVCHIKAVWF